MKNAGLVLVMLFVICGAGFGQMNTCTYQYAFGTVGTDSYFSFCLTPYGTLASLQTATGQLLDTSNPIEGFMICDDSGYGLFTSVQVIPGLGWGNAAPTVTQPKGAGKLPIIFNYGMFSTTVTATPSTKTITFTSPFIKQWGDDKYQFAYGPWIRVAGLLVDGSNTNNFAFTSTNAFGFLAPGDGVMIGGTFNGGCQRCGISGNWNGVSSGNIGQCGIGGSGQPFVGQGEIFSLATFETQTKGTSVFNYKLF